MRSVQTIIHYFCARESHQSVDSFAMLFFRLYFLSNRLYESLNWLNRQFSIITPSNDQQDYFDAQTYTELNTKIPCMYSISSAVLLVSLSPNAFTSKCMQCIKSSFSYDDSAQNNAEYNDWLICLLFFAFDVDTFVFFFLGSLTKSRFSRRKMSNFLSR